MSEIVTGPEQGLLIVFTDLKGSTEFDENAIRDCSYPQAAISAMAKMREDLFKEQINKLPADHKWKILKNVGDALILTAEVSTPDAILICINDLQDAWNCLFAKNVQIRIAAHYAPASHIVNGGELKKGLESIGNGCQGFDIFLSALKFDIFGPGINRTARLAHAPSGPLFLISEQVLCRYLKKKEFSNEDIRASYASQEIWLPGIDLRGPIPLVNIKGVEVISFDDNGLYSERAQQKTTPWWVWEIAPKKQNKYQSFGAENKKFQTLRITHAFFRINTSLKKRIAEKDDAHRPDKPFQDHLSKNPAFNFFVDFSAKILDVWSFYSPSDSRNFDNIAPLPTWNVNLADEQARFLPFYIVFCSCPTQKTDIRLRNALIPQGFSAGDEIQVEPVSYQIHPNIRFRNPDKLIAGSDPARRLYLILFQIKQQALQLSDNPNSFFSNCPKQIPENGFRWDVIIEGILRGDKDGFLLLSLESTKDKPDEADQSLRNFLENEVQGHSRTFFEDIAPIKVFVCQSLQKISGYNKAWLEECLSNGQEC